MKQLKAPESQIQEVLHELYNRLVIDRKTMMLSCNVLNLPDCIFRLRKKGVKIISNEVAVLNQFGREVKFVQYSLQNKGEAAKIYETLKANQSKTVTP